MADVTLRDGDVVIAGKNNVNGVVFPDNTVLYSAGKRVKTYASSAGKVTINWNECEIAKITITEGTTFTFTGGADMASFLLEIKQTGAFSVILPTTVRFGLDVPVYATSASGKRDKLLFMRSVTENTYDLLSAAKGF